MQWLGRVERTGRVKQYGKEIDPAVKLKIRGMLEK